MTQLKEANLDSRLAGRIQSLGLTLLRIQPDTMPEALTPCSWLEQAVIASPTFRFALGQCVKTIEGNDTPLVPLLDGVSLFVFESRQSADSQGHTTRYAALFVGGELLGSSDLRRLCDQSGLDLEVTRSRAESSRLIGVAEAQRLATLLSWMQSDVEGLANHRGELSHLSEELANNYEELSLLYKLSCSMTLDQPPGEFFINACNELQEVSGLGWIALQLADDQPRLEELSGRMYTAGLDQGSESLQKLSRELIQRFAGRQEPVILDDCSTLHDIDAKIGKSMLVVPLVREREKPSGSFSVRTDSTANTSIRSMPNSVLRFVTA